MTADKTLSATYADSYANLKKEKAVFYYFYFFIFRNSRPWA